MIILVSYMIDGCVKMVANQLIDDLEYVDLFGHFY